MWMMPLHLHINQKFDYDYDIHLFSGARGLIFGRSLYILPAKALERLHICTGSPELYNEYQNLWCWLLCCGNSLEASP